MQDYFLQCSVSTVTQRAWLACSLWLCSPQRGHIHMIPALRFACSCQIMSTKTNKKKYPAPVLNAAEMFSWWHFSLSTNCLSLKCCVVIPIPRRRGLLLRMKGRNAQENNLFENVSTGFMNNDSLLDLSSKVQFWWYDNAENVFSPWGGSCFSGVVLLFPHYCNAVPEALCQSCCAAACECWGWWRSDPGGSPCFVLVYSWILDICFLFF